jgi:hypothetical protein
MTYDILVAWEANHYGPPAKLFSKTRGGDYIKDWLDDHSIKYDRTVMFSVQSREYLEEHNLSSPNPIGGHTLYKFENHQDAILFKLRWGGL